MALVGGFASHAKEDELADLRTRHQLQRLVRSIENLQHLTIVDTWVHETSSDVH